MLYLAAGFAALGLSACEQSDVQPKMDVQIYLDENNTYLLGDPVRFVFRGAVDYVTVWTGDATHEYRHRHRTERPVEDILSATLSMSVMAQYSTQYGSLKMGVAGDFPGLTGPEDAANGKRGTRDKQTLADFGEFADAWTSLEYEQSDVKANDAKTISFTSDITPWKSNFSLAFRWLSGSFTTTQRSYSVTPVVTVKYKDNFPDVTLKAVDLGFMALSLADQRQSDVYDIQKTTADNGSVSYTSYTTPLFFGGASAWNETAGTGLPYAINSWCVSRPMGLNRVVPDKGVNIKTLSSDLPIYEYEYAQAGSYTVTFVLASGNIEGEIGPKTVEFNITIIDPIK